MHQGKELYRITEQAKSGFNAVDYAVEIDQALLQKLPKKSRDTFEASKNGRYYLPKGEYALMLSGSQGQSSAKLIVE